MEKEDTHTHTHTHTHRWVASTAVETAVAAASFGKVTGFPRPSSVIESSPRVPRVLLVSLCDRDRDRDSQAERERVDVSHTIARGMSKLFLFFAQIWAHMHC